MPAASPKPVLNPSRPRGHHATREKMWLNVYGLHDPTVMAEIGRRFKLHPLVQEDILNTQQRPKSDEYADYQYIVAAASTSTRDPQPHLRPGEHRARAATSC